MVLKTVNSSASAWTQAPLLPFSLYIVDARNVRPEMKFIYVLKKGSLKTIDY